MDLLVLSFKFVLQSQKLPFAEREINSKVSIAVDNINFIIIYLKVIFVKG